MANGWAWNDLNVETWILLGVWITYDFEDSRF